MIRHHALLYTAGENLAAFPQRSSDKLMQMYSVELLDSLTSLAFNIAVLR